MSSSDDDSGFVDLTQQSDDDAPAPAAKAAEKAAAKKKPAAAAKPAGGAPAAAAPAAAPAAKPKKAPAAKKDPPVLRRELPLTLGPSAGKEGKSTLLLELDTRAGGFGVDMGAIGRASFPRVAGGRPRGLGIASPPRGIGRHHGSRRRRGSGPSRMPRGYSAEACRGAAAGAT